MRKIATLFLVISFIAAKAQTTEDSTAGKINLFSSIGLGVIDKSYQPATGNSIQTSTGAEFNVSRHSGLGIFLTFDSYDYHSSGTYYDLNGTLRSTALALFYRYVFGSQALQPYLRIGGGGAWLTVPTVSDMQGMTKVNKETQFIGLMLGEAGFQFHVQSRYSLFLGVERTWFADASLLNASLRSNTVKVGLISAL